jgi:hypothetical protein
VGGSSGAAASTSTHWWSGASQANTMGSRTPFSSGGAALAQNSARAPQGTWSGTARSYQAAPAARPSYSAPAYRAPAYAAPRYAAPAARSYGAYHSFSSYGGGWARSAPSYSFSAPRSFGGGFSGGGFHGGGFGGGHGGGHH